MGIIDEEAVLPTILVPNEEPAWTHYHISTVRSQICYAISNNWERNQHNMGGGTGGYRRARINHAISIEMFWSYSESAKEKLNYAIEWSRSDPCSKRDEGIRWPLCDYVDYRTSYGTTLHEYIEWYRSHDYSLRDKLVHLTHLNYDQK